MTELKKDFIATDFIDKCHQSNACQEATDWMNSEFSKNNNITIYDLIEMYVKNISLDQSWAVWALTVIKEDLEKDLRILFLEKIKDPMIAFNLYLKCNFLTKEEVRMLEVKFKGKLPRAEKELEEGIVEKCQ